MAQDGATALLDYAGGSPSGESLSRLAAITRRLSKAIAWKYGRPDLSDDLSQEIWLLMPVISKRYESTKPAEPYLLGYMSLTIRSLARKTPQALENNNEGRESLNNNELVDMQEVGSGACIIDVVDRQLALDAIVSHPHYKPTDMETVPYIKKTKKATQPQVASPFKPRQKREEIASELGPQHKELRDIRIKLDMTQSEFALAIGMKLPTLVAYEHGRTNKVPAKWLENARELLGANKEKLAWRKKFDGVPMLKIIERWAKRLGVASDDLGALAALTGTTTSTISRWRNGHVRPSPSELAAYEQMVEINAVRLTKSKKAIQDNIEVIG